jgi:hypothetical protein
MHQMQLISTKLPFLLSLQTIQGQVHGFYEHVLRTSRHQARCLKSKWRAGGDKSSHIPCLPQLQVLVDDQFVSTLTADVASDVNAPTDGVS